MPFLVSSPGRSGAGMEDRLVAKLGGEEDMLFTGVGKGTLDLQVALRSLSSHWSGTEFKASDTKMTPVPG